jgi:hypothetical protein
MDQAPVESPTKHVTGPNGEELVKDGVQEEKEAREMVGAKSDARDPYQGYGSRIPRLRCGHVVVLKSPLYGNVIGYIYIYIYTHTHTHTHTHIYIYIHTCIHTYVYTYIYIHTYVCTYVCI